MVKSRRRVPEWPECRSELVRNKKAILSFGLGLMERWVLMAEAREEARSKRERSSSSSEGKMRTEGLWFLRKEKKRGLRGRG